MLDDNYDTITKKELTIQNKEICKVSFFVTVTVLTIFHTIFVDIISFISSTILKRQLTTVI